jgi:DNA-binding transcriptional MerR regulator/methylmalonyl-CoA mutase cobalamin-binding subunit
MTDVDSGSVDAPRPVNAIAGKRVDTVTDEPVGDQLRMRQISQLLDVPPPTIRSWERRYGLPHAGRSSGGHRRYTGRQVDELRWMRDLIARGQPASEAAAMVLAGHTTSPGPLVETFLRATRELAPSGIARTLDAARESLGLDRTVDEVLLPAMREVGEWWHNLDIDVAHEHLATNATRTWLANLHPTGPLRPQPPIILSCGPLDHHTLGLEAIGALLRQRRWDCRLLGARTPVNSLARAVAQTDAAAVVLVGHISAGRTAAIEALHSPDLRHRHVFYGGGAFKSARARRGLPGHYLGTNFTQATDMIAAKLTPTSA